MKLVQSIIICVIIFCTNIISQDSSVVSLTIGNTWIYNYSKTTSSDPTIFGTQVKEIVKDTIMTAYIYTCDTTILYIEGNFKKVRTTTYIDSQTTFDKEFWLADSNMFFKNIIWHPPSFRYVYNHKQSIDTSWYGPYGHDCDAHFIVDIRSDTLWGTIVDNQLWGVAWHFPTSPSNEYLETITTYYYGPIREQYSSSDVFGGWVEKTSILKGAIIDGIIYGDTTVVSVSNVNEFSPTNFILYQNYPNPFNPTTTIRFTILELRFTTLRIYDVLGKEIATLVNEEKPAGIYEVEFSAIGGSASGGNASTLPSGIYFYQLRSGNYVETKKMVLLR